MWPLNSFKHIFLSKYGRSCIKFFIIVIFCLYLSSIYLCMCMCICHVFIDYLYVSSMSICVYLCICFSMYLSMCLFPYVCIHLYICLSVYLFSIYLYCFGISSIKEIVRKFICTSPKLRKKKKKGLHQIQIPVLLSTDTDDIQYLPVEHLLCVSYILDKKKKLGKTFLIFRNMSLSYEMYKCRRHYVISTFKITSLFCI